MKDGKLRVGVIGIDHRHIYEMLEGMLAQGSTCAGWHTEGTPQPLEGFAERFNIPRVADPRILLEDREIDLVLISAIPADRARIAIEAMRHGKDVMTDKPGCTTLEDLAALRQTAAETGRIWSINFSERFQVPSALKAQDLVAEGAIGKVVQTLGMGPHRLNRHLRPDWFFQRNRYGGILTDIASHQIDQFLIYTGSTSAEVVASSVGNFANPGDPGLEDFGEVLLRSASGQGYIRVDWYTPDALPTWGDGRLTILGTEGYIELRKYADIAGRPGTDHLFLVNKSCCEHIDCSKMPLTYYRNLAADVLDRGTRAMSREHPFTVTELAIKAQQQARIVGNFAEKA